MKERKSISIFFTALQCFTALHFLLVSLVKEDGATDYPVIPPFLGHRK